MKRCEGYTRHGGVFTFGPVRWVQCDKEAVVLLKIKQEGEDEREMPACLDCWTEAQKPEWKIQILSAKPITQEEEVR